MKNFLFANKLFQNANPIATVVNIPSVEKVAIKGELFKEGVHNHLQAVCCLY